MKPDWCVACGVMVALRLKIKCLPTGRNTGGTAEFSLRPCLWGGVFFIFKIYSVFLKTGRFLILKEEKL